MSPAGEFRSHCVVYDWRDHPISGLKSKAGLSGHDLTPKDLAKYPVSFQLQPISKLMFKLVTCAPWPKNLWPMTMTSSPTCHTMTKMAKMMKALMDRKGKSGGSGKSPAKKTPTKLEDLSVSRMSFSSAVEEFSLKVEKIVEIVVMGMKIAEEAYSNVLDRFATQINHAKIVTAELVAAAGKLVTKFTPPAFLKPAGDETKVYKYNREKNEPMFTGMMPDSSPRSRRSSWTQMKDCSYLHPRSGGDAVLKWQNKIGCLFQVTLHLPVINCAKITNKAQWKDAHEQWPIKSQTTL